MKLIALCGAAGAGKDTVADLLPARKIAFADALYEEVAENFSVEVEWLKERENKERAQKWLDWSSGGDYKFSNYIYVHRKNCMRLLSPRQALQLWGDYRRSEDPEYFVKRAYCDIRDCTYFDVIVADLRFENEAEMVRDMGGEIWQVKRAGIEAGTTGHISDTDGSEFNPDRIISNDGTLISLAQKVKAEWEESFR